MLCRQVKDEEQEAAKFDAVFPCILRILPACVFNKKDPIIVGVDIEEGIAKVPLTSHTLTFLAAPRMLEYTWHTICQFHRMYGNTFAPQFSLCIQTMQCNMK